MAGGFTSRAFIARAEELRRLAAALDRAEHAQPQLVLLAGEAGVGKTRLLLELFAPDNDQDPGLDVAAIMRGDLADEYPYITEIAVIETANHDQDSTLGWCDDQIEFEFGLDLLLDGLEGLHAT